MSTKIPQKFLNIIFIVIIVIITLGVVPKTFQNDTFFNISIGKYILKNGIDMQEHFSWISGLTYTYSHWAFDILVYLIYSKFGFNGLYCFVFLFTILTNLTLYTLLKKRSNNPLISAIITIITAVVLTKFYTVRSQIISFLCFIIEIYCIEEFIETNKKRYAITIILLGIIIANFHAATWPLTLILFMPYLASNFIKNFEKKLNENNEPYKISFRDNYNIKNLTILFLFTALTGLLTPIHNVPYTYIIKSMFGPSNFDKAGVRSIDFIAEMKPLISITNTSYIIFLIIFISFLLFLPTKLKLEHGFLVLGLIVMTLSSSRYVALLIFLGSYVLVDLINQCYNLYLKSETDKINNYILHPYIVILLMVSSISFALTSQISLSLDKFFPEDFYPINATKYIKENLDYKNIRLYNGYEVGSYLMFNGIPVFIDSRLDVYCSEFNDTDVFKDYIYISTNSDYYEDIFSKYDFTHVLLSKEDSVYKNLLHDSNYVVLYEDEYFILFQRNIATFNYGGI